VLTFWPYVWQLDPGHTYDEHLVLVLKTRCDKLAESNVKLNALKVMVENAILFFYSGESSTAMHAPQMVESLSTRSWEIILAVMKQLVGLTLGILKSLYPQANLDATGEGFTITCSDVEALKLVEDSAVTSIG
jgi:hypothetical protein